MGPAVNCPSCHTDTLALQHLEDGLLCYACITCAGNLLSLSPYLDWVDQGGHETPTSAAFESTDYDSKEALLCPKCTRIMVKFKVLADAAHSLDFCFSCEEVWLDPGEWTYLKKEGLHTQIVSVSTDIWQRKLREEVGGSIRADKFKQSIGEPAYGEAQRFKRWLETQPKREEILRYLSVADGPNKKGRAEAAATRRKA